MIWTPQKDRQLRELVMAGATLERIAAILRTSRAVINARIDRLGISRPSVATGTPSLPRVKWLERADP